MGTQRVLGVDPGTRLVGWAVLERRGVGVQHVASGVWRLGRPPVEVAERLLRLRGAMQECVRAYAPACLALEAAFFGKNARSALRLGEARGAAIVTAAELALPVLELPPALVKRRVAGSGAASKEQIAHLVRVQLALAPEFESSDESDALAVALCALLEGRTAAAGFSLPGAYVQ